MFFQTPKRIAKTGDDLPAEGLVAFVWRMSGWHQVTTAALALVVAGLAVVPLELQRRIVDDVLTDRDPTLLFVLAAAYLVTIVTSGALKLLLRLYQGWLSESAIVYCRNHLVRLRGQRSDDDEGGTVVSIVNSEIEAVGGFVGTGVSDPISQLGILVAVVGYMVVVEPVIGLVSVVFLGPQVILVPVIQRKLNALVEKRIGYLREISDDIADGDTAGGDGFEQRTSRIYRNRVRYYAWKFLGKALLNFLNAAAPLMVLAVGGWMVIEGQTQIGVVVAFISGFARMSDPLRDLIAYYRLYAQTSVKHDMIADWMRQRS